MTAAVFLTAACGGRHASSDGSDEVAVGPAFSADSAWQFCDEQCRFGPRIMNSDAHEQCGRWIADKFRGYGCEVTVQRATLRGYDGTPLLAANIIASYRPAEARRILLCAHWDSRPWADNDPDEANWKKPVMAANDGASGVAVMLEVARLLSMAEQPDSPDSAAMATVGVDFVCFDAEDWGTPQWADRSDEGNTWALGAQYWAAHLHRPDYKPLYGILLDMVGGEGARFYHEGYSEHYASHVVSRVWRAAQAAGYGSFFPRQQGGTVTDDHVPVNEVAGIPCIDIIPYYPDCRQSSFGSTWHTLHDDMQHIDKNTLRAVGQTVVQVLFSER